MVRKALSVWRSAALAGILAALAAGPATAQEFDRTPGATVTLGFGGAISPNYFGAKGTRFGPTGLLSFQELVLPGGLGIGSPTARPLDPGFGLRGAFRYIPTRRASDYKELRGLDTISDAVELGIGLFHVTEYGRVYGEVRRGFGGHDGWVGELGIDAILRPTEQFTLSLGPRALWGDEEFVRTYFGVTSREASRSRFSTYRPGGGLVSTGLEFNAQYDFGNDWGLQGVVLWARLQGDAGNSPITRNGSRDQYSARLIVTRRFSLRLP